jgi:hypothetical protein
MIERQQTKEDVLQRISKLESALRGVERWSMDTATDLTAAGYDHWRDLVPWMPQESDEPSLPSPNPTTYQLSSDVNTCLRGALMGRAAAIDARAVSFHPRWGHKGLRRDLARASQMLTSAYDDLQQATAFLGQKKVRLTHRPAWSDGASPDRPRFAWIRNQDQGSEQAP